MPRARTAPTARVTKRPARDIKPYDRSSPVSSEELVSVKGDGDGESEISMEIKDLDKDKDIKPTKAKSEYNKLHLVSLIIKVSRLTS
jgi:hypothetical protein